MELGVPRLALQIRLNLTARILLILSGVEALSTLLALVLQDRTLAGGLPESALAILARQRRSITQAFQL